MSNYLSFRAGTEGKASRKNIKGLLNHTMRKTLEKYKNHSNEMINRDYTNYNIDWTQNGNSIEDIIDNKIENEYSGKRNLRKDAVLYREVITQASPNIYKGMSLDEKREKTKTFAEDSLEWFKKEFGESNVLGYSAHLDETNPHVHFMVMPMTDDGRLSQKDFFRGPAGLKRQHREYREHMISKGWEFELENKHEDVDSFDLPTYKRNAKTIENTRDKQKRLQEKEEELDNYVIEIDKAKESIQSRIDYKFEELQKKEEELKQKEKELKKIEEMQNKTRKTQEEEAKFNKRLYLQALRKQKDILKPNESKKVDIKELDKLLRKRTDDKFGLRLNERTQKNQFVNHETRKYITEETFIREMVTVEDTPKGKDLYIPGNGEVEFVLGQYQSTEAKTQEQAQDDGFDKALVVMNEMALEFEKEIVL